MNDQEAWKSFQNGDSTGLEKIYRAYYALLYNYGYKWLGNAQLVEDSIQDLFLKIIRNKKNLATPNNVRNYLFFSFRTIVLDKFKSKKYNIDIDEKHSQAFDLQINPETELIKRQDGAQVQNKMQKMLQKLTPRQREAIYLRYYEGFSYPEVSGILNLTPKATYKLIGRALFSLRNQIKTEEQTILQG